MNKLSSYLLSFLGLFATILQPNFASAEMEKSSTDSIKGSAPFEDWSEERFAAYDDGLIVLPNKNTCWHSYQHRTAFRKEKNRLENQYTGDEKIFYMPVCLKILPLRCPIL